MIASSESRQVGEEEDGVVEVREVKVGEVEDGAVDVDATKGWRGSLAIKNWCSLGCRSTCWRDMPPCWRRLIEAVAVGYLGRGWGR